LKRDSLVQIQKLKDVTEKTREAIEQGKTSGQMPSTVADELLHLVQEFITEQEEPEVEIPEGLSEIERYTFRRGQLERLIKKTTRATVLTDIFNDFLNALTKQKEQAQNLMDEWKATKKLSESTIAELEQSIETAEKIEKVFADL